MSRDVRSRQMGLMARIDLADVPGVAQTPRMLVQVYDGGAIPTTVPKVYLTHPVMADAADTEGATPSYSADSGVTVPVVVLGPTAPTAGDYLVAHAIGGRWVAGEGGGSSPCIECGPCCVPKRDLVATSPIYGTLTLHYDPGVLDGFGLAPAAWDWYTDCFSYPTGRHARFVFGCTADGGYASAVWVWTGPCTLGPPEAWAVYQVLIPWVCDPLRYDFNGTGDPAEGADWTVTVP